MVRTIKIKCPQCKHNSELFLSMNPTIIVLNCPECWTPLLLDKNGVRTVTKQEIKEMVEHTPLAKPEANFDVPEYLDSYKRKLKVLGTSSEVTFQNTKQGRMVHRESITIDDVLDLRIELERCLDVNHFLNKI